MGIKGLWMVVKKYAQKPVGKFEKIFIDATMLTIWLASPISHLPQDQFELVFSRNLGNKIIGLRKLLKEDSSQRLIFVFDSGTKPSNKIRERPPVKINAAAFNICHEIIAGLKDGIIITAHDEADLEIARNVSSKDLVFSDDSDMFIYSDNILRFDLTSFFNRKKIVRALGISLKQFIEACNNAANDYNTSSKTFLKALKDSQ